MDAYYGREYAQAHRMFEDFFSDHSLMDEMYASAKYFSADALLKLGRLNEAAINFEFLVNNFTWTNFREEAIYNLGLIYYSQENYDEARRNFKMLLDEYAGSEYTGSAYYWIGESYSVENRLEDAILFLEEAVNDDENNTYQDYSKYTLATVYEKIGDYESAVKYYDQVLTYHRDSPLAVNAQIRIGICYFKLKDYQTSILELNNPILSDLPSDLYAESLYLLANSYYRVEDYPNAERSYKEIINQFPSSPFFRDAQYGLAWAYFQQTNYNEAYKIFDFLSGGTDSVAMKSYYWKGESKRYAGYNNEAYEIFNQFLQKYPNSNMVEGVKYQIGVLYFNNSENDLASRYLITATSSEDKLVRAKSLTLLGEIELNKKQYASARNYFEPVLTLQEADGNVQNRSMLGLGISLFYLNDHEKSLEYLLDIDFRTPRFEEQKVNFYIAENYFALDNFKEAINRYDRAVGEDLTINAFASYGKAYSYFNSGDYQNAAFHFNDFIKSFPVNSRITDARLRLADSYYGSRDYIAASRVYKDIFSSSKNLSDDPQLNYQYAQTLFKSGDTESAITQFNLVHEKFPASSFADEAMFTVGWIKFQQRDYVESIISYKRVLEKYPSSSLRPIIYYSIGDANFNLGRYDSAVVYYQKVLSEFPRSEYVFDAVNGIQFSYVARGETERAISFIDQFSRQNPNLSFTDAIFFKKGEIYYGNGDYENAKTAFKDFIASYPRSKKVPDAYYWIGKSSQALGQNEEAIFNFNKVFEDYKTSEAASSGVIEIGNIYNEMGNYPLAVRIYDDAIRELGNSSRKPEFLLNKGLTLIKMERYEEAYEVFEEVSMYHPGTIFADKSRIELGLISLATGNYETADGYFRTLAKSRSDDIGAKAQYYLGVSLFEQNKFREAEVELQKVRSSFATYDEWLTKSLMLRGEIYEKLEQFEDAKNMYRAVLSKHGGDVYGKEAQEKLRKLK